MAKNDYTTISDGTYVLAEIEEGKQFLFFRKDEQPLSDISNEPMELYQACIAQKMMNGEITGIVAGNVKIELAESHTSMLLTVLSSDNFTVNENATNNKESDDDEKFCSTENISLEQCHELANNKKASFLKRLIHKIFG